MPLPPIDPPELRRGQPAPDLPDVQLPSGLEALGAFMLLAQTAPELLQPQAQQLQQRDLLSREQALQEFQLQQQVTEQENALRQQEFENRLKLEKAALDEANKADDQRHREFMQDVAKKQLALDQVREDRARLKDKAGALEFISAKRELNFQRIREENRITPEQRMAAMQDPRIREEVLTILRERPGDTAAVDRIVEAATGIRTLDEASIRRQAMEATLSDPGVKGLVEEFGISEDEIIAKADRPRPLDSPQFTAEQRQAVSSLSQAMLRRMSSLTPSPEDRQLLANAERLLAPGELDVIDSFEEALFAEWEALYGVNREDAEAWFREMVQINATKEPMGEGPPGSTVGDAFRRVFGRRDETLIGPGRRTKGLFEGLQESAKRRREEREERRKKRRGSR